MPIMAWVIIKQSLALWSHWAALCGARWGSRGVWSGQNWDNNNHLSGINLGSGIHFEREQAGFILVMTEVLRGRHWQAGTDTFHTAPAPCNLFFPQFRLLSAGSTPNPINSRQEVFPAQWWGGAGWTQWRNLTTSPPRQTIMAQTFFNSDRTDINITLAEVQPWTGRIQFTVICTGPTIPLTGTWRVWV